MRRTIFILSALLAATAFADPTPVAPQTLVPAPYWQKPQAIASNGRGFVVASFDSRGSIDFARSQPRTAVYTTQLDANGVPIDPRGTRIADAFFDAAKIARRGAGYLLVYAGANGAVAQPLDEAGKLFGAAALLSANLQPLALGTNGTTFLLVARAAGDALRLLTLAADGTVIRDVGAAAAQVDSEVWALADGSFQFVASRPSCTGACATNAILTTVSASGVVSERNLFGTVSQVRIGAGFADGRIVVADVADSTVVPVRTAEYRVFEPSGAPVHEAVTLSSGPIVDCVCAIAIPSVGWDGREFLVAYQWPTSGLFELRAHRVASGGTLIDTAPQVLDPNGTPALMATSETTTEIVWGSDISIDANAAGRNVRAFSDLGAAPTAVLSRSASLEREPRIAVGPSGLFAVWRDGFPNSAIEGAVAGQAPVTIAPAGVLDAQAPALAPSRSAFLVVWRERHADTRLDPSFRILAKRVAFDGKPIDAAPIVVATDKGLEYEPDRPSLAVASSGDEWLVVYPGELYSVRAVRVGRDGAVLDAAPILLSRWSTFNGVPGSPSAIWNGSRYVVVWIADQRYPGVDLIQPLEASIYAVKVAADGAVDDVVPRELWNGRLGSAVALASDGGRLLLTWAADRGVVGVAATIEAMVLALDGTPLGAPRILDSEASPQWYGTFPQIDAVWDGSGFVVAWTKRADPAASIRYIHVSASGVPIDRTPLDLAAVPISFAPALASTPNGPVLAFGSIAGGDAGNVARVFVTTLDASPKARRRAASP